MGKILCLLLFFLISVVARPQSRPSTASSQVKIIDTAFNMPELGRTRRIWIYIPADASATKRYPVLYMHDGQNLFDNRTSYAGEWGIDEFLDTVSLPKCIVVGIDNGAGKRINELSPYDMEKYGKGEGPAYCAFIVKTLKPYIDKNYPALRGRTNTWIGGSSLGGLISFYALLQYPKVFGSAAVFSPSFWIAPKIYDEAKQKGKKLRASIYFYAGKHESESMAPDMLKMFEIIRRFRKVRTTAVIREEGKHNEEAWRKEFPFYYKWQMGRK